MKAICLALVVVAAATGGAYAKGCLKGAAVGGVAGHYAGHHAVLGAVGGCIVGRHEVAKHAHEEQIQREQQQGDTSVE